MWKSKFQNVEPEFFISSQSKKVKAVTPLNAGGNQALIKVKLFFFVNRFAKKNLTFKHIS